MWTLPLRSLVLLVGGLCTARAISLRPRRDPDYYWPHARGHPGRYSTTDLLGPEADFNTSLAWSWHHPDGRYHTVVTSAPLIDDKKNIYIAGEDGVRKFGADGEMAWYYKAPCPISTCPSLMDGRLFGSMLCGVVFALDMGTGQPLWMEKASSSIPGDTGYVESYDGVVVAGVDAGPGGGSMRAVGLDAKTGAQLWEFKSSDQLWNFHPQFTADGAWVVMSVNGAVQKLGLHSGALLWKAEPPEQVSMRTFSDGGVILGPDDTSYTCSNYEFSGQEGQRGALRAYAPEDGRLLWEQVLDKPCNSWPVVSRDGETVVVPTGAFVASPSASSPMLMWSLGVKGAAAMHNLSLSLGSKELSTYGLPDKTATIRAFRAKTGEPAWSKDLPPYGRMAALGDEEGYLERKARGGRDQCLPAQFGSPTISGDGTVYVGRADGNLYAVRPEGSGAVVNTYQTGAGFLHPGTSFAPGMMAVTSCDGLFVWKV